MKITCTNIIHVPVIAMLSVQIAQMQHRTFLEDCYTMTYLIDFESEGKSLQSLVLAHLRSPSNEILHK